MFELMTTDMDLVSLQEPRRAGGGGGGEVHVERLRAEGERQGEARRSLCVCLSVAPSQPVTYVRVLHVRVHAMI